jgi:hypothetical protein
MYCVDGLRVTFYDPSERCVQGFPPRRLGVVDEAFLDALQQPLNCLPVDLSTGLSKTPPRGGEHATLNFLADVNAKSSASTPIERKHENFFAHLPKVDDLLDRGRYLGMRRSTRLLKRLVELA